ncbi:NAD(P)/FAD-dependent oxidoreductase [Cohnella fermenti]|uniref:Ferredoxin--NADP reductase n=1 Tax=Cohnella fermenti TaxID=2565925 RepID=A0A4V3WEK7_9BACL|nr:NAD(P)/FAD-dependent oxidoreductase [Cohnella fermenti]THF76745.1 NAD(P)/FAD-dependent oxidoreductase [Cohnella fermenti]
MDIYDLTIVGGGPAGMYAAFYSGMRAMKTKLIEAKQELGGFMRMYPEKTIWDVGAVGPARCEELIAVLEKQARTFHPTIVLEQEVHHLHRREDGVMVLTSGCGQQHLTRTVLLCAGRGIIDRQKLELEGANQYEVSNLYYTITDVGSFRGQHVLVSGGGNSAVDWANELHDHGAKVTVVHRREQFDALEYNIARMHEHAQILTPYTLHRLHGQQESIESVSLMNTVDGTIHRMAVDSVVVNHGYKRDYGPLLEWGLIQENNGIRVNERMHTDVPGVFGAGDFVDYGSKVRLIAGAFNDAVLGVNSALHYLDPVASKQPSVSSHNVRFRELNRKLRERSRD